MRIAWIGPAGHEGGVQGMGRMLLRGVLAQGVEVDYFGLNPKDEVEALIGPSDGLQYVQGPFHWQWDRWYSRKPFLAFLSSMYARARSHNMLCEMLVERHRSRRYDCIMQFSQMELLQLQKYLAELPPVIVYPCVHAAGELRWHRKESRYARRSEGSAMHYVTRRVMAFRAAKQRRQSHLPALMIGMSKRFNQLMAQDYGLPPDRMRVLYHPIEPGDPIIPEPTAGRKLRIVFAGRISVRKGIEMVVELSKRLDDLADQIQIEVVGGHTQWSDYRKHLEDLNPRIAKYLGSLPTVELMKVFVRSDLLIVPSHYEPGGIVVGEAIARGLCVVASDEVGSAEPLNGPFVEKFQAGDMAAFERATRDMIRRVQSERMALGALARQAAIDCFDPAKISQQLIGYCDEAKTMTNHPRRNGPLLRA